MNSKMLSTQMNGVFNVHFVITKITSTPQPIYNCQVVARHEYHDTSLSAATPGILVVQPLNHCVTLLNAQVETINDKYSYLKSVEKVDYTKGDNIYYNQSVFTLKRINLLAEMAEVVLNKLLKVDNWDKYAWDRKCECKLVEPLFTIAEDGLDEMIKRKLTIIEVSDYA